MTVQCSTRVACVLPTADIKAGNPHDIRIERTASSFLKILKGLNSVLMHSTTELIDFSKESPEISTI